MKNCYLASALLFTLLTLHQHASAALVNSFTYENSAGSMIGGIVTGTISFTSLSPNATAANVAADSIVLTALPQFVEANFNDTFGFTLGENLFESSDIDLVQGNIWDIDAGVVSVPDNNIFFIAAAPGSTQSASAGFERLFFRGESTDIAFSTVVANDSNADGTVFASGRTGITFAPVSVPEPTGCFLVAAVFLGMASKRSRTRKVHFHTGHEYVNG